MDGSGYSLRSYALGSDSSVEMLCIAKPNGQTFIDELTRDKKGQARAGRIAKTIERVLKLGNEWAWQSKTFKEIKGTGCNDIVVLETRVKGSVIRVATYIDLADRPVFLFDFDAHSGSDGGIKKSVKEMAVRLASYARDLSEAELHANAQEDRNDN